MKKKMYALFDKQVNTYMNPLYFVEDAEAIRWLTTVVNEKREKTNINLYPHQFILIALGEYDDTNGEFINNQRELIQASSVKDKTATYTIDDLFKHLEDYKNSGGKLQ